MPSDKLAVWNEFGPWAGDFGSLTNMPATAAQEAARTRETVAPVHRDLEPADVALQASTAPEPHVPSDNAAIAHAQDNIAANLEAAFDRYVADFKCRPCFDRLERIRGAGRAMLDHELRQMRQELEQVWEEIRLMRELVEPSGIGMSDRSD